MEWFFQGLGTLLVGILLGASGDRIWMNMSRRSNIRQQQRAGNNSTLTQSGRDSITYPPKKPAAERTGDESEQ